jgi:uncharacterized protein (TIGR03067 family)
MRRQALMVLLMGGLITGFGQFAVADPAKEEAIKKDRAKYQGTWRVVALEIDGKKVPKKDARKITVTNHADGTWIIMVDAKEVSKGTSTIAPTQKPKTIDFLPTNGVNYAKTSFGIYEINGPTRKLCFASPGAKRPTEFAAKSGSGLFLVIFQRENK